MQKLCRTTDYADGSWLAYDTDTLQLDGRGLAASYDSLLKHICIRVIHAIRGEFYFGAGSRLLFLAEFLESGIGTQRIPDWIEFKKGLMQLASEDAAALESRGFVAD